MEITTEKYRNELKTSMIRFKNRKDRKKSISTMRKQQKLPSLSDRKQRKEIELQKHVFLKKLLVQQKLLYSTDEWMRKLWNTLLNITQLSCEKR